jgi:hypothetical protein
LKYTLSKWVHLLVGRECLNLKEWKTEKKHIISLGQPAQRNEQGYHDMVTNPGDLFCIVRIYKLKLSRRLEGQDSL